MKLLVVKPTALGDVAQALQVVPYLRASGWCERLDWVVDEDYVPLVQKCPWVDHIIAYPRRRWRSLKYWREWKSWGDQLSERDYDVALDLQGLARSGLITLASGAVRRIGLASSRECSGFFYHERVPDHAEHAVDRYALACGYLCGADPLPGVYLHDSEERTEMAGRPRQVVLLHPYSQRSEKCWPWRFWNDLVELLPHESFVMVGRGPWFPCEASNVIDLRNKTDLNDLLEWISGARGMISTDSGPLHMAAALGIPCLGLYGATRPGRTRPRGQKSVFLNAQTLLPSDGSAVVSRDLAMGRMSSILPVHVSETWRKLITSASCES
ncbi:MAG: glycosyltransferase family 9 protein [Candidatus Methylacidiphilales bacterium]